MTDKPLSLAERRCATCDSEHHLTDSYGKGGLNDVCRGCFFIWYDGDIPRAGGVLLEDIRAASLTAMRDGTWPFDGHSLAKADEAERERAIRALSTRNGAINSSSEVSNG